MVLRIRSEQKFVWRFQVCALLTVAPFPAQPVQSFGTLSLGSPPSCVVLSGNRTKYGQESEHSMCCLPQTWATIPQYLSCFSLDWVLSHPITWKASKAPFKMFVVQVLRANVGRCMEQETVAFQTGAPRHDCWCTTRGPLRN